MSDPNCNSMRQVYRCHEIDGIKLERQGGDMVVSVDARGEWVEVIRERADGPISHIVEQSGIESAIAASERCFLTEYRSN